jgi:hypothetical protein
MADTSDASPTPVQPAPPMPRRNVRRLLRILALVFVVLLLWFSAKIWTVVRAPVAQQISPLLINDVSQLNPIHVNEVITPTTTTEIIEAVRKHAGPISIGGARHSMGGQIATGGALFIDMRNFNRILDFSPTDKTITVQAGTRVATNPGAHRLHESRRQDHAELCELHRRRLALGERAWTLCRTWSTNPVGEVY